MENETSEAELLASVLEQSEFVPNEELPPVPDPDQVEEAVEEDTEELEDDIEETEEAEEAEEDDDDVEEESDEDEVGEPEEAELPTEEEIDWDYSIPVTIDGETQYLSLEEVRKGYATQQHLSNQGRELGEARKAIDEERSTQLGEIEQMAYAMNQMLGGNEQQLAQQYHNIDQQINEARNGGDTYRVQELKDEREVIQGQYWNVRQQREGALNEVAQAKQQAEAQDWQQKVEAFYTDIAEVIPEYNEEYANDLRTFGQELGLSDEFMQTTVDPTVVKVLDDYRKLKNGVSAGAKKRAKAPVKKAPLKKPKTVKQKKASKQNIVKARAFREDASLEDQDAFLKQHAARTLGYED